MCFSASAFHHQAPATLDQTSSSHSCSDDWCCSGYYPNRNPVPRSLFPPLALTTRVAGAVYTEIDFGQTLIWNLVKPKYDWSNLDPTFDSPYHALMSKHNQFTFLSKQHLINKYIQNNFVVCDRQGHHIGHRLQAHQLPGTQPATVVGDVTDPTCRLVATSSPCTSSSSNTTSSLQLLCNFHADVSSRFKPSHCNCVADRTLSKTNCHATIMQLSRRRLTTMEPSNHTQSTVTSTSHHASNCHANQAPLQP